MVEQIHSFDPDAPLLGELGSLQTRLARNPAEIRSAQKLRYEVFYQEMGASPSDQVRRTRRDYDAFDPHCDHLLVLDAQRDNSVIVGTYRMMRESQAQQAGGFYSQSEYDLAPLINSNADARFLELGRSCILSEYRNRRTMELLWHGTWSHAVTHHIDIMFGCASFDGTDPQEFAECLSWLGQNVVLEDCEDCPAIAAGQISLRNFAGNLSEPVSARRALSKMPPLIKGYLRLGAQVASSAVIDEQFGTIDILVVLKVAQINPRYLSHFGVDASRFSV